MSVDYDNPSPIHVKIVEDSTKEKRPTEFRTSHRTYTLNNAQPYVQITGYDPALVEIFMNVMDNPIVICRSIAAASDANNITGAVLNNPNGRIMPIAADYRIPGPDEMWIATNQYPTRVGVTLVRCI